MIHQIELRPDVEARVQAQARAEGVEPESFIRNLVENAVRTTLAASEVGASPAARLADLEVFFKEMARNSDKIPQLPDEAFTRESFYQDHD